MVSEPKRRLLAYVAMNHEPSQWRDRSLPGNPAAEWNAGTENHTLGVVEWIHPHDPAINLTARALQRAVTWDTQTTPRRMAVGTYLSSLQSLEHLKVKIVCPSRFTEEGRPRSFSSGAGYQGTAIFISISKKAWKTLREQNPPRGPAYMPKPLLRGSATLPKERHMKTSRAGSSARRPTG